MTRVELERVLTLNRVWQPITTVVVKQALTLVFRGRARVVCPESYQMFDWANWLREKAVSTACRAAVEMSPLVATAAIT